MFTPRRAAVLLAAVVLVAGCADVDTPTRAQPRAVPPTAATVVVPSFADLVVWRDTLRWNDTWRWNDTIAENARAAPPERARTAPRSSTRSTKSTNRSGSSSGRCGGDLPPCWVMNRESGGNIRAYNPTGCSGRGCRGKWQCDPRTCSGTGTEAEQDAEARTLWDGGRGCAHWDAC